MSSTLTITRLLIICVAIVVYGEESHKSDSKKFLPAGQKMLILGLFQNCLEYRQETINNNINNINDKVKQKAFQNGEEDTIQKQAEVCQENVEQMVSKKHAINKALNSFHHSTERFTDSSRYPEEPEWSLDDIEYRTLAPLCSQQNIDRLILDIHLNKEYYINVTFDETPENLWNNQKIYLQHSFLPVLPYTRILAMLVFSDEKTHHKLIMALNRAQFPIYQLNNDLETPLPYTNVFNSYNYAFKEFHLFHRVYEEAMQMLRTKESNYFVFIFFESGFYIQDEFYKRFRALLESQTEFCFKHFNILHLNNNDINNTLEEIKSEPGIQLLLTFGDPTRQVDFFNKALAKGLVNLTWIFQDVDEENDFIYGIPETTKAGTYQDNPVILYNYIEKQDFFWNTTISKIRGATEQALIDIRQVEYFCKQKTISMFNGYIFGLWVESEARKRLWYTFFHQRYRLHVRQVFVSKKSFYALKQNSYDLNVHRRWPFSFKRAILNTTCKIPTCDIGYEMKVILKDKYYGQNCIRCVKNYYKKTKGNSKCIKCPIYMVSNDKRGSCFDTYEWNYQTLKRLAVIMALLPNIIGEMFALFAILTFLYKRDTPMIRALDLKVTIFHLLTLSVTFILLPFLFIGRPSKTICILRPICVSTLLNLSLASVIIKSQRLLRIFNSKLTILSEGEMRRYNMYTGTSVLIICAIGQVFILLPVSKIVPMPITIRVHEEKLKDVYCNTEEYINIQFGYSMILQLYTAFQAFKCRSLPGPFNEAMSIVYSTLIVIVTYSASFPIYYFLDRIPSTQSNVHFTSLSVASLLPMLILYGYKLFVVIFRTKKNTKEYIRSRMWTFSSTK